MGKSTISMVILNSYVLTQPEFKSLQTRNHGLLSLIYILQMVIFSSYVRNSQRVDPVAWGQPQF